MDDTRAAADWLTQQPRVDAERLALVGNSLGGYTTLAAGADHAFSGQRRELVGLVVSRLTEKA